MLNNQKLCLYYSEIKTDLDFRLKKQKFSEAVGTNNGLVTGRTAKKLERKFR